MKISGKVLDRSDSMPLPGASINMVESSGKVTTFGTSSDVEGNFELNSDSIQSNTNFRISYIGYKSQLYSAAELQNKTIILSESATLLDELVINRDFSLSNNSGLDQGNSSNSFLNTVKKNKKSIVIVVAIAVATASFFLIKKNI